jgi:hypothetical protein
VAYPVMLLARASRTSVGTTVIGVRLAKNWCLARWSAVSVQHNTGSRCSCLRAAVLRATKCCAQLAVLLPLRAATPPVHQTGGIIRHDIGVPQLPAAVASL